MKAILNEFYARKPSRGIKLKKPFIYEGYVNLDKKGEATFYDGKTDNMVTLPLKVYQI